MNEHALTINALLCVDGEGLQRFGRILRHLAVGLVDQATNVTLIGPDARIQALALGPIKSFTTVPITWPFGRRRIREAVELLASAPPTICHGLSADTYDLAAAVAEAFDADLILQVSSLSDCDAVSRRVDKRSARYIACSRPLATILEEQLRIPMENIELVRPGLMAAGSPACFSQPGRQSTILCTAPLEKDHAIGRLIEAAAVLRDRGHPLLVFLTGQGSHEFSIRALVKRLNLSSQIMIAQPLGDAAEAMKSADVFVRPCPGSTFDVDALQAMAAGMAVVIMPNVICDYFHNGKTALVCEKPSVQSLADAIGALLSDRDAARRMAAEALEYIRTHHSMSEMGQRTAALYRELALARATFPITERAEK